MTKAEFAQCLAYLSAAANKAFTTEQAEVYFDQLGGLPFEVFKTVVRRVTREHLTPYPTLPPVAALVQVARDEMRRHLELEQQELRRLRDERQKAINEVVCGYVGEYFGQVSKEPRLPAPPIQKQSLVKRVVP